MKKMRVAVDGPRFIIAFAEDVGEVFPAQDHMDALLQAPNLKKRHAALMRLFETFAREGAINNPERFKKVEGSDPTLVEFKAFQERLIGFFAGRHDGRGLLFLTHGFKKKTDKIPPREITRAYRIRQAHLVNWREEDR